MLVTLTCLTIPVIAICTASEVLVWRENIYNHISACALFVMARTSTVESWGVFCKIHLMSNMGEVQVKTGAGQDKIKCPDAEQYILRYLGLFRMIEYEGKLLTEWSRVVN